MRGEGEHGGRENYFTGRSRLLLVLELVLELVSMLVMVLTTSACLPCRARREGELLYWEK